MAVTTVRERVHEMILQQFGDFHKKNKNDPDPEITDESHLTDIVDSVDMIELHMDFEKEFGLSTLDELEWEKLKTVGEIIAHIEKNKKP